MSCEATTRALLEGRPLRAEEEAHRAACPACARLVAALGAPPAAVSPVGPAPQPPSPAELTRRVRQRRAREGGLVLLAAAAVALLVPRLLPEPDAAPPPAAPLVAVSADTGALAADDVGDAGLGDALDADEVIRDAAPATDADEALLAVMVHLDHLGDPAAELPGAPLVDLLDPYDSTEPLVNLGEL